MPKKQDSSAGMRLGSLGSRSTNKRGRFPCHLDTSLPAASQGRTWACTYALRRPPRVYVHRRPETRPGSRSSGSAVPIYDHGRTVHSVPNVPIMAEATRQPTRFHGSGLIARTSIRVQGQIRTKTLVECHHVYDQRDHFLRAQGARHLDPAQYIDKAFSHV